MEIEYLYLLFFTILVLIWVLGEWKNSWIVKSIGAMFMVALGLYTFINGIQGTAVTWFDPGYSTGWIFYAAMLIMLLGLFIFLREVYLNVWTGGEEDD